MQYHFDIAPPKLYCTEIVHRALRFANLPGATLVEANEPLAEADQPQRADWWRLPANEGGSYVMADEFVPNCTVLVVNAPPTTPVEARRQANIVKPIQREWERSMQAAVRALKGLAARLDPRK